MIGVNKMSSSHYSLVDAKVDFFFFKIFLEKDKHRLNYILQNVQA